MSLPTTQELQDMLNAATPGPWFEDPDDGQPCVTWLVSYSKIDGYANPQARAEDAAQRKADRTLAAQTPDLAAENIRLRKGIKKLAEEVQGVADGDTFTTHAGIAKHLRALLDGERG